MIDKVYVKLRHNVIAEYRRLYTPFFYINLKTKSYKFESMATYFFGVPVRFSRWACEGEHASSKLREILDLNNEKPGNNILRMRV